MKSIKVANLNIITLAFTYFLWGFVNYVYLIQIQPLLLSIYGTGDEAAQILGFILSIASFSAVIPLLLGFCADRFGRKIFIVTGEFLSLCGLIGLSIPNTHILTIIFSIILFNVGIGVHDPPLNALIYESSGKKRGLAISFVYNSSSIAGIIASLLLQTVNDNFIIFFQLSSILFIFIILINFSLLRDIKQNTEKIVFPLLKILKEPRSRLTAIAFAIDAFSWGLPLSIANGVYILLFDVDVNFIATLTLIQTILLVLLQYPAGLFVDRFGRIFGLIIGEITGIIWIIFVQMAVTNPSNAQEFLIIGYAILGVSIAFWRPSVIISFISLDPSIASTNFGILSFIQRLGWVPTAALGGIIFSKLGFSPLLIMTFIGTSIVIFLISRIDKLEKNEISPQFPNKTLTEDIVSEY